MSHRTLLAAAVTRLAPFHFRTSNGSFERHDASSMWRQARVWRGALSRKGVGQGGRVLVMLDTSPDLIAAILGTWSLGAAAALVAPPVEGEPMERTFRRLGAASSLLQPDCVVHDFDDRPPRLDDPKAWLSPVEALNVPPTEVTQPELGDEALAIVQLTSGSTGTPKGVPLTHGMLRANVQGLMDRVKQNSRDHIVSWLPMHHDMGFSALTMALMTDAPLTLLRPGQFARAPWVMLEAISTQRGTLSPNPPFAYALLARMAPRLARARLDLSAWRYAWAGAEPVFAEHLAAFESAFRPHGLRRGVLQPAYGMAEAVVAVTCGVPGADYRVLHVDGARFRELGEVVQVSAKAAGALSFVSNGRPLNGVQVRVRDEAGLDLPEGRQGRVWIRGPNVATGYLGGVEADRFQHGWFDTGDLGFLSDGEMFVSGRIKDLIIRGGQNISPQPIEWTVESLMGLRSGQVAAISVLDHAAARERIVVVVGKPLEGETAFDARVEVGRAVAAAHAVQVDEVVFTAPVRLPRTTSGKIQRGEVRRMYQEKAFSIAAGPVPEMT